MINKRGNKGITLISLIVTVIVLIILAGVAIDAIVNDSLPNKTTSAKAEYALSIARETIDLMVTHAVTESYVSSRDAQQVVIETLTNNLSEINNIENITAWIEENSIWVTSSSGSSSEKLLVGFVEEKGVLTWKTYEDISECRIGGTYYLKMQDAINAAKDGDVLKIENDVTIDSGLLFNKTNTSTVTIDFNNHTVSGNTDKSISLTAQNKCEYIFENANFIGTNKNIKIISAERNPQKLYLVNCNVTGGVVEALRTNTNIYIQGGTYNNGTSQVIRSNMGATVTIEDGTFCGIIQANFEYGQNGRLWNDCY